MAVAACFFLRKTLLLLGGRVVEKLVGGAKAGKDTDKWVGIGM